VSVYLLFGLCSPSTPLACHSSLVDLVGRTPLPSLRFGCRMKGYNLGIEEFPSQPPILQVRNHTFASHWNMVIISWCLDNSLETVRHLIGAVAHSDPLSARSLARIRHWIEKCEKHHQCRGPSNPKLPTRVLDVGSGERHQAIGLVNTNGQSSRCIALGHCVRLSSS